jgi:peptidoglycan pentaglycine glycine transferase (the first glycine)
MRIYSSADKDFCSPQEWDEFTRLPSSGHLLQSWPWGELKACFGWRPLRIAAAEGSQILAGAQVLFRPFAVPGLDLSTAYVPKGPLLDPPAQGTPTAIALIEALHDVSRRRHAISLKAEPDWPEAADTHTGTPPLGLRPSRQERGTEYPGRTGSGVLRGDWLAAQGFVASAETVQPRRTVVVDLATGEDDILAQMKSKTRYNIRLAQRKGVTVRQGTTDDLTLFHQLLLVTGQRAGFGVHSLAYYTQAWHLFAAQDAVALFLASYEGQILAGIMVFAWGSTAYYMYGGSSDEERQRMPTYLLQWEAMRWAKTRGCNTYDLWGIPDVDEQRIGLDVAAAEETGVLSTGLGGLYRFKRGFGGKEVRYVGAYDYVYNRPLYSLLTVVWKWRRRG